MSADKTTFPRRILWPCFVVLLLPAWAAAASTAEPATDAKPAPTLVYVVRHAERAAEPKDDPLLSPEGSARAGLLAQMLVAANIRTIVTSQAKRTQDTALPLANRLGIAPNVVPAMRGELPKHIEAVVAEVRKARGAVLVVGHSNTVGPIVAALSSSTPMILCETSYANLFVVTLATPTLPAAQLKFGKADPPPATGCQ
jgi:phosphohistidine phosphatase SixA